MSRERSAILSNACWDVRMTWHSLMKSVFLMTILQAVTLADIYKIPLKRTRRLVNEAVLQSKDVPPQTNTYSQEGSLRGKPGQGYYIEMEVGTPPQLLNVLVDTGSSNFALAAAPHPDITKYFSISASTTFKNSGTDVDVPYTQGNWKGHLGKDKVHLSSLPNTTVIANIACITSSDQFFINGSHWQGILGLAFSKIARPDSSVKPLFDSLMDQAHISNSFSMQLCGTIDTDNTTDVSMGGTLIVGGLDPNLYTGEMVYALLRKEWYYEVIITDIQINQRSLKLDCKEYNFDKTIVDSGTTNLRLPQTVFAKLVSEVKQQTVLKNKEPPEGFWKGEEILCWAKETIPWSDFPAITLTLAESHNSTIDLVVSPQQYLRAVSDEYNEGSDDDCFKFAVASSNTGTVIGAVIMEGFYINFDRENKKIGFAKTTCSNRNPNAMTSHIKGPVHYSGSTMDCGYNKPENSQSALVTVAYVMAGVCGACIIPLILMVLQWQWNKCTKPKQEVTDIESLITETTTEESEK